MDNAVELIGTYGGDIEHALSAWTSTSRSLDDKKIARIPDLLTMLARNGHHTPFEKSSLHFLVRCDIASHIHLIKHRIGVSVNAESARYKELNQDEYYVPEDWNYNLKNIYEDHMIGSYRFYHHLIEMLVQQGTPRARAKESARFVLPYANQITQDVMFNFRSFMHFQGLRNDDHAQLEIREIAQKMKELVEETGKFKYSFLAFEKPDYEKWWSSLSDEQKGKVYEQ